MDGKDILESDFRGNTSDAVPVLPHVCNFPKEAESMATIEINLDEVKRLLNLPPECKIVKAYLDTFTHVLILEVE